MQSNARKQKHGTIRLSDPVGGCGQKTAVGSSVLALDEQGPVGQTSEAILSTERGRDGGRGGFGKEENKLYLPSPRSRLKGETMPDVD